MKVLFVSNIPNPYQLDFIAEIRKKIIYDVIFTGGGERNLKWNKLKKVDYLNLSVAATTKHQERQLVYQKLCLENYECVILGGYRDYIYYYISKYCKKNNIKFGYWFERPFNRSYITNMMKSLIYKKIFSDANFVIGIGKLAALEYKKYSRILNIPYSQNLDVFFDLQREYLYQEELKLLYVGQLIKRKNVELLVRTINSLPENIKVSLTIVGAGELHDFLNSISGKNIKIVDFIQFEELPAIYSAHDVFVFPSSHDGWALVIPEAMASGLPIVTGYNIGASNEYLVEGVNAKFCNEDINSLKQAILFYYFNRDKLKQHGVLNRQIIQSSLSNVHNSAERLQEFLNEK